MYMYTYIYIYIYICMHIYVYIYPQPPRALMAAIAFWRSAAEACSADLANFSASFRPSLGSLAGARSFSKKFKVTIGDIVIIWATKPDRTYVRGFRSSADLFVALTNELRVSETFWYAAGKGHQPLRSACTERSFETSRTPREATLGIGRRRPSRGTYEARTRSYMGESQAPTLDFANPSIRGHILQADFAARLSAVASFSAKRADFRHCFASPRCPGLCCPRREHP